MADIFQIDQLGVLKDFEGLAPTLHGGAAFRFAMSISESQPGASVDLFDLTPFTADVDLLHAGPESDTWPLYHKVLNRVPNADCFRWEIRSTENQRDYEEALSFSPLIPARRIAISANGIYDPFDGIEDIRTRRFRYQRTVNFEKSPLFEPGKDLEVFTALLYMQTIFEANAPFTKLSAQPGLKAAREVFVDASRGDTVERASASEYLIGRLIYLVINCLTSASPEQFWQAARQCSLDVFLARVASSNLPVPDVLREYFSAAGKAPRPALSPSAHITEGHAFRIPPAGIEWMGKGSERQFDKSELRLVDGQRVLAASEIVEIHEGMAPSGSPEFLFFDIDESFDDGRPTARLKDTDISMIVLARRQIENARSMTPQHGKWDSYAFPCIVQRRLSSSSSRLSIRLNTLDVFQSEGDKSTTTEAQFFLVGLDPENRT